MCHMSSTAHKISVKMERMTRPVDTASSISGSDSVHVASESQSRSSQPRIDSAMHTTATEAYRKLIKTAYMLAIDGLPLTSFKTLVKVQKSNGVRLISGTGSGAKAREFVHEIANCIRDKLSVIMCSVNAFSVLSDGSQARKTRHEKELVLIRLVRGGIPVYYCVALQDVDKYGDANADNLKSCIDDCFLEKLHITRETYTKIMVSCTSDGAAVNTGIYNGLLTQMKNDSRPWFIPMHCVSHRLELAIKDSLLQYKEFSEVKDFMQTLYYLFQQSGKIKRHFNSLCPKRPHPSHPGQ